LTQKARKSIAQTKIALRSPFKLSMLAAQVAPLSFSI
jgi:hypothetical protein